MKKRVEHVEMVDGRVYWSKDGWATVWKAKAIHRALNLADSVEVTGREADLARFLAIVQSTSEAGRS